MFSVLQRCDAEGFWTFLTIAIGAIIFCSTIRTNYFPMFFPIYWYFFLQKTLKTTYFTKCSNPQQIVRVSVVRGPWTGGHSNKNHSIWFGLVFDYGLWPEALTVFEQKLLSNNIFSKIFDLIVWYLLWAATKSDKLLPSSKKWWFSMSQSQSVRFFLFNHRDQLFSDVFQIENDR